MSLETLNLSLFHVINGAQDASQFIIRLAIFFANDLLYILLFILTFLWFYGDQDLKNRVIKSVFLTCVSLLVGYVISLFYHHP
ncbi:undecaprenyl-pyrophosphatase YbjG, partial [Acinetobacter baumannii]